MILKVDELTRDELTSYMMIGSEPTCHLHYREMNDGCERR